MSAAVMSNYYFAPGTPGYGADSHQSRVHHWMLAQMAQYPPPPPGPEQQHVNYNALYPAAAGAQQLSDHDQLQYSSLNQPIYPKGESAHSEQQSPNHPINRLAHDLQHQNGLDDTQRQQSLQHIGQQIYQAATHGDSAPQSQASMGQRATSEQNQKSNRLRKACDSCSIRKVKCDESGPPCRACASLEIPCTFDRPSRRRGPPNRHAEAIKRRRMEEAAGAVIGESPSMSAVSAPSSPTHAARALAALSSSHTSNSGLSAESICPVEMVNLLIDDFFTYIHPLTPFPHEPSFREAWKRREDLSNSSFLALLAAMIATLVTSFPRGPQQKLKAQNLSSLFPDHMSLVNRCQKVCVTARGPGYLESESLNVYDAATSYFLGLVGTNSYRWRQGRLYFGECLTIIRTLGLHRDEGQHLEGNRIGPPASVGGFGSFPEGGQQQNLDCITREMGRRVFWTMFVGVKSCHQLGAAFSELAMPPPTPSEKYPPLPMEVDDFCIYPTHIDPQPAGLLPLTAGFNANVRIYNSYNALSTMEIAWGIDSIIDWERQRKVLYESLRRCKDAVNALPHELVIRTGSELDETGQRSTRGLQPNFNMDTDAMTGVSSYLNVEKTPEQRRRMQYEIQKANVHVTSLATRSFIVEKYWNLCEARDRSRTASRQNSPGTGITQAGLDGLLPKAPTSDYDMVEFEMQQERQSIMNDLLVVLGSIKEVHMEPNADSFTMKVRAIAGTLHDAPDERKGQLAAEAQEYLAAFLKILIRLERVSPANSDTDQPMDEEAELRSWADLREYQMKFAQQGGLLGLG